MPQPDLSVVVVKDGKEPRIISEAKFLEGDFEVWTGEAPKGLHPVRNKTSKYLPKPKAKAKK